MSYAVHKETIKSSQINFVITGNFVNGNKIKLNHVKDYIAQQILLVRSNFFEVYEMFHVENQEDNIESSYKYNFLIDYHVFDQITSIDKFKLNSYQNIDSVVMALDYAKIAIVAYDPNNCDFRIVCLYNLENENLSNGKKFYKDNLQIVSSKTYDSLFILSNDVNVTVLTRKYFNDMNQSDIGSEEEQLKYLDTVLGEEYFEPSYYINFRDYSVNKIVKFNASNKENELLDYNNLEPIDESEYITLAVLFRDSGMGVNMKNEFEILNSSTTGSNFLKTKVCFGIFQISKLKKKIESFEIFENLDTNSFDFIYYSHTRIALVLSPYSIQFINLDQKVCRSIILNPIYVGVILRDLKMSNITNIIPDYKYANLSLDLRGGGFLSINDWQWIFTTSKGFLFAFSFTNNLNDYSINKIHLQQRNEYVNLDAPYKFITMPHLGMFLFCSYFADGVFVIYKGNNYMICNKMINISPIINFSSNFDRLHTKLILTSGYDKQGYLNFLYEKLFFEIIFTTNEFQEISYLKSLNFHDEINSRYLIIVFKNGKNSVYEVGTKLENITDKVQINHDNKFLNCGVIKLQESATNNTFTQFIVVVYQSLIQVFNSFFKLIVEISLKDLINISENEIEDRIKIVKISQNILVINTYYDKFVICRFNNLKNKTDILTSNFNLNYNEEPPESLKKLKLNDSTDFEFFDITNNLYQNPKKILKFDINNKLIEGKNFLVAFRENSVLEIYDLNSNINTHNPIFENKIINELPVMVSDTRIEEFKNDYEKCTSDFTTNIYINNNHPQTSSFSTPEQIFFDLLETKIVFSIIFKNGTIVFYEVFFILREGKFFSLKMKKFFIDYVENIDYREFFYSEESNLYIKFENIKEKAGVLLNIKGNQKLLFEVNGRLKFLDFENNLYLKRSISAFSDFSKEGSLNGFIYFENGILKLCNLPKNYEIKEIGLIKRNPLNRFPVNMNLLIIPQGMINLYFYILVEKELKPTALKVSETTSITVNKFSYYLTLRTEDPKIIDQIEFPSNEVIIESKIVELMDLLKKKTKYIAVGVNIMDEKGEEVQCKAKLYLYNVENGRFIKVLENELRGVISMIHSIEGVLIVSEGSRIFLYQYVPLTNEIKKISVIDNKNLVVCSKIQTKFIVTGDVQNSATWIVFKYDQDINSSSIYILGNDDNNYRSIAIDFWIDDSEETFKTGCLLADDKKNLHLFTINVDSTKSNRFREVADFHIGKKMTELRYYSYNNKSLVYYSACDGSIGFIKPISKIAHDRLSLLCEFLYNHLPFRGGINPKMFFSTSNRSYPFKKEKGNIIDMDILYLYMCLPITAQKIIAKNVVLSREIIIQNINEILLK